MKNTQKGFLNYIVLISIALIGAAVFFYWHLTKPVTKENEIENIVLNEDKKETIEINAEVAKTDSQKEQQPAIEQNNVTKTELKSGTQIKTKTATSTTTAFNSNNGSLFSTTTISKEDEEEFAQAGVYKCGNRDCFERNFKSCTADSVTISIGGLLTSVYYEIKNKTQQGCDVLFKYLEYPDPDWVNKEMVCEFDNTLDFESATIDVFQLVSNGKLQCKGDLYNILKPQF